MTGPETPAPPAPGTTAGPSAGYLRSGLPYNRFGSGPRALVLLPGLQFAHKPMSRREAGWFLSGYRFLEQAYTITCIGRRPGLPRGSSLSDIAADYAETMREEFDMPVDVIGVSTGGSIALHLAADQPEVVRRLVVHSAAHALNDHARSMQRLVAKHAAARRWRLAFKVLMTEVFPRNPVGRFLAGAAAIMFAVRPPSDPMAVVAEVEAEDALAFRDRLHEISAPTLVAGGRADPFYSPQLFEETAAGIPGARLALYDKVGHPASGKPFERDVLAFLQEG